jgi:hypothetical protein
MEDKPKRKRKKKKKMKKLMQEINLKKNLLPLKHNNSSIKLCSSLRKMIMISQNTLN